MTEAKIPEMPPVLLPGRSAFSWIPPQLLAIAVALLGLIAGPVISAFAPTADGRHTLLILSEVILVGSGLAGQWYSFWRMRQDARRELAAGYTTLFGRAYPYWQLDPKTGEVLRRPGEREAKKRR